jgi:CubicO group peptidase (beta-lactamase class C family)
MPHRYLFSVLTISLIVLVTGCGQKQSPIPPEVVSGVTGADMDVFLTRLNTFGFHGSTLVARGDDILIHKAYGLAQVPEGIENGTSTVFSTGSVTKQFTAAAILKLEIDGKLTTSDPITRFFDDVPDEMVEITIHHLLTHSSGLTGEFGPDRERLSRDDFLRRVFNSPLEYAVGDHYEYSNAGYSMLAAIIEVVSGKEYEAFLIEHLFTPAGMFHTGLRQINIPDSLVSHSHNEEMNYPSPLDRPDEYYNLKGNGGIVSTPADMYRWYLVLNNDDILPESARRKLFIPYVKEYEDGDSYYGYGWVVQEYGSGDTLLWHNGGAMPHGWSCAMYNYVQDSLVCIVFSNAPIEGTLPVDDIVSNLSRIVRGKEYVLPPEVASVTEAQFAALEGNYVCDEGNLYVGIDEGAISIAPDGQAMSDALFPSPYAPMLAKYNGKTQDLIKLMAADDFEQAMDYFRAGPGENRWEAMANEWWQEFSDMGKLISVESRGTIMAGEARTYCQLNFEKGTQICRFFWMGGKCGGMMATDKPLARRLLPQSSSQFVGYSLKDGSALTATFSEDNTLTVQAGDRQIVAHLTKN